VVRSAVRTCSGVDTEVVVRTQAEVADVVARNPWPDRTASPGLQHVLFLSAEPAAVRADRVGAHEQVQPDGREVWVWYGRRVGTLEAAHRRARRRRHRPDLETTVTTLAGM
jgi:uncharacterized protein (DUF1697 family)